MSKRYSKLLVLALFVVMFLFVASPSRAAINTGNQRPLIGADNFDLIDYYLGVLSGADSSSPELRAANLSAGRAFGKKQIMDAKYSGVGFFRASISGFGPIFYGHSDILNIWKDRPAEFWAGVDAMMADLNANGIKIVPSIIWQSISFPVMANETESDLMNNPNSASSQLMDRFVSDFINRYKNNPAILFYDSFNEMNLGADLDIHQRCLQDYASYINNDPNLAHTYCGAVSNFTTDQMISFETRFVNKIKALDPNHLVASGYSINRADAEHLRRQPEFSSAGADWTADSQDEFKKNLLDINKPFDIVSIHYYDGSSYDYQRFGYGTTPYNADFLSLIKQITDQAGKKLFIGEFGDNHEDTQTAPFATNVLNKVVQLGIPYSAYWTWEFYQFSPYVMNERSMEPGLTDKVISLIKNTNQSLGNSVYTLSGSDNTAPQLLITWPRGTPVGSDNQFIYSVASDNSGQPPKLEIFVNGVSKASKLTAPYCFSFKDLGLSANTSYNVQLKATDQSNNSSSQSVTFQTPAQLNSNGVCPTPPFPLASVSSVIPTHATDTPPTTPTPIPTATLTVNGSHSATVYVGDTLHYSWSSTNGKSFSSRYTTSNLPNATCSVPASSVWVSNTSAGTFDPLVASVNANCDFTLTYTATGAGGQTVSDSVRVKVLPNTATTPTPSPSPYIHPYTPVCTAGHYCAQQANVLSALDGLISRINSVGQTADLSNALDVVLGNLKRLLSQ